MKEPAGHGTAEEQLHKQPGGDLKP